jgi:hypothetical protein
MVNVKLNLFIREVEGTKRWKDLNAKKERKMGRSSGLPMTHWKDRLDLLIHPPHGYNCNSPIHCLLGQNIQNNILACSKINISKISFSEFIE